MRRFRPSSKAKRAKTSRLLFVLSLLSVGLGCNSGCEWPDPNLPGSQIGEFEDDYEIQYSITSELWRQLPNSSYRITRVDLEGQYLIAQNSPDHPTEPELWSRIDWMELEGMAPFNWAFCLSAYDATGANAAEQVTLADRTQPRSGCNGFPFSRMKRRESTGRPR